MNRAPVPGKPAPFRTRYVVRAVAWRSLTAALCVAVMAASGEAATITRLTPGYGTSRSTATTNGGVVVVGDADGVGFRWTLSEGLELLADIVPSALTADGSAIVGYGDTPDGTRAFRWSSGTGAAIGTLVGFDASVGTDVSHDGAVLVGYAVGGLSDEAFRWTAGGGMEALGALTTGASSHAYGVSGDGSVVVGFSGSNDGDRAFRWTTSGGMASLGVVPGGIASAAAGISADGAVIVGYSTTLEGDRAFRWRADMGMTSLGVLADGATSYANGVSADGAVVVGRSDTPDGSRAFRWSAATGLQSLDAFLVSSGVDMTGWAFLEDAIGVSPDGNTFVGWGLFDEGGGVVSMQAFVANVPEPSACGLVVAGMVCSALARRWRSSLGEPARRVERDSIRRQQT